MNLLVTHLLYCFGIFFPNLEKKKKKEIAKGMPEYTVDGVSEIVAQEITEETFGKDSKKSASGIPEKKIEE